MSETPEMQALVLALGKTLDRFTKRHPGLSVLNVCGALGFAAGTTAAVNIPSGCPEADRIAANVVGMGFASAVETIRKARAS